LDDLCERGGPRIIGLKRGSRDEPGDCLQTGL
jgi:hypothetical protein